MPVHVRMVMVCIACILPLNVLGGESRPRPFTQDFLVTGYYSPLSGQCCYVKGGEHADKILNGQGTNGADGTPVYPGMIAAPPSYPFGTRIVLEGIGTFTVNDRGGAIQELGNVHRLDIWAGHGEEGLARALAIGLTSVKGTVFFPGARRTPEQEFAFDDMPAPIERLEEYLVRGRDLMALKAKLGDKGLSVSMLQDMLRDTGYFAKGSTGYFGEETQKALAAFIQDHQIGTSDSELSSRTAAHLLAAVRRRSAGNPVSGYVDPMSAKSKVVEAQRILRFLGYYRGRTTGQYDDNLFAAILQFQKEHGLVGDSSSPGAGRIGPLTMKALHGTWNKRLVAARAEHYLTRGRIQELLTERGNLPDAFLHEGYSGDQVWLLQELMANRGHFPLQKANGYFGPLTKESVIQYQLAEGIISSRSSKGAGVVGPSTLTRLREQELHQHVSLVRGQGWEAL